MIATMVEGAVAWHWWLQVLLLLAMGGGMGWWARGAVTREMRRDDDDRMLEDAQRAARVYQREIDAARKRHPSGR